MQACSGCKGIINKESNDPYYCSFCITQGRYSLLCPYCGEHYRLQDGAINMCGKCLMKHMQGVFSKCEPPTTHPEKNYTTIETTVYFECGYCGQPLESNTHHDHGRITISPCKHCLEQARNKLLKGLLVFTEPENR